MTTPNIDLPNMTETAKILTMMRDALIAHDTRLQGLRDDLNDTTKDVTVLKETVLTGTANSVSQAERIRNLETFAESIKDTIKYWGRLVGGALLLNFIGFMTGVLVAVIRFLPILERLASKP